MRKKECWTLTLVTHKSGLSTNSYLRFIEQCLKSGVRCVQLREKLLPYPALLRFGRNLKALLDIYSIPLIINDNVELCKAIDASGVHLGQSDTDIVKARAILGSNKIIGQTVNTVEQINRAETLPVDYLGLGAVFPTPNKSDVETIWGLTGLQQASSMTSRPIIAIGGINESNALSVMKAGANGIAAIGAFHNACDPFSVTKKLLNIIKEAKHDQ